MKKCDCYHIQPTIKYRYNPTTSAPIPFTAQEGVCWGTKEMDICSCGGDKTKCDFYPEVREKTLQEVEPEFGEWISVEDRLPETDGKNTFDYNVLVFIPKREECCQHGIYLGKLKHIKANDGSGNFWGIPTEESEWTVWGFGYMEHPIVTHWMPLPEPPKGE